YSIVRKQGLLLDCWRVCPTKVVGIKPAGEEPQIFPHAVQVTACPRQFGAQSLGRAHCRRNAEQP
ncbi:MAG: hypothetical protein R2932_60410, partial [Caldilineaceae bacterium]